LAKRRVELVDMADHWFGFLWNLDHRKSRCEGSQPLGYVDLDICSRDVPAKHDDDPLHQVQGKPLKMVNLK